MWGSCEFGATLGFRNGRPPPSPAAPSLPVLASPRPHPTSRPRPDSACQLDETGCLSAGGGSDRRAHRARACGFPQCLPPPPPPSLFRPVPTRLYTRRPRAFPVRLRAAWQCLEPTGGMARGAPTAPPGLCESVSPSQSESIRVSPSQPLQRCQVWHLQLRHVHAGRALSSSAAAAASKGRRAVAAPKGGRETKAI